MEWWEWRRCSVNLGLGVPCEYNIQQAHLLYKLYSLQLNCTYSNYTQSLLHVQPTTSHKLSADFFWSAVQQVVWCCIYVVRESYPEIRFFKEIQLNYSALPQLHSAMEMSECSYLETLNGHIQPNYRSGCNGVVQEGAMARHACGSRNWTQTDQYRHSNTRYPQQTPFSAILPSSKYCFPGNFQLSRADWVDWRGTFSC
jgi:hypothetical protein